MDGDDEFYLQLDVALTDFIRLARHPMMTVHMSAGIDPGIDRRLLVLLFLVADRGPLRAAELVDVLAVDQSTVSRQLASLEQHGLVERAVDPNDRRAALVAVTDHGLEVIAQARGAWRVALADLTSTWSDERRQGLLDAFRDLADGFAAIIPNARFGRGDQR